MQDRLRRANSRVIALGELVIYPEDGRVVGTGGVIDLTPEEAALLEALAGGRGLRVRRSEISRLLWEQRCPEVRRRVLLIYRLNSKLAALGHRLECLAQGGYRLAAVA